MCTNCEEKIKKIVWRSNNSLYSMYIYFHCLHCQDITLCLPVMLLLIKTLNILIKQS